MANETMSESVKTRIPQKWKTALVTAAEEENLDLSDIVRRALDQFITRRKRTKAGSR